MEYQLGDRIEYWLSTLEDGRTVHRGTIVALLDGGLAVQEDYQDWPSVIALGDVIRRIDRQRW